MSTRVNKELDPAEKLPKGVCQQPDHHRFITFVISVSEVVEPDSQVNRLPGTTDLVHIKRTENSLKIDLTDQNEQRMVPI